MGVLYLSLSALSSACRCKCHSAYVGEKSASTASLVIVNQRCDDHDSMSVTMYNCVASMGGLCEFFHTCMLFCLRWVKEKKVARSLYLSRVVTATPTEEVASSTEIFDTCKCHTLLRNSGCD
jgi:hypothetical protein